MAAPLIAVTTSLAPASASQPERASLNAPYIRSIQRAGGVPILLSPYHESAALERLLDLVDGLVLTGGGDVSPALYGEAAHETVSFVSEERDHFEIAALEGTMNRKKPMLFICRGMQIANVGLGGSLHQDIASAFPEALEHSQNESRDDATHAVSVSPGSALAGIVGQSTSVNSMHHQSVKTPGRGVEIVACAPDGVVEGIELPGYASFAVGVQWHPEHLAAWQPEAQRLFATFIQSASSR